MSFGRIAFFLILIVAACGCSRGGGRAGTAGGNPEVRIAIEVAPSTLVGVSSLGFCPKTIRFVPTTGNATDTAINPGDVNVGSVATGVASVVTLTQNYSRVEMDLTANCPSTKSVSLVNGNGSFSTGENVTVRFEGQISVSQATKVVRLQFQPILAQLSGVSSNDGVKTQAEAVAGTLEAFTAFTWVGTGGNANWSTGGNWFGGAAPGTSDTAVFDANCGTHCTATIDTPVNIGGISMNSSFTGTVTQGAGSAMTVGSAGWTQGGGSFAGAADSIQVGGLFSLTGGTFTSTSSTLGLGSAYDVGLEPEANVLSVTGGTFNDGGGTVAFNSQTSGQSGSYFHIVPGTSLTLNHVMVNITNTFDPTAAGMLIVDTGKVVVRGNLTHQGGMLDGAWELQGNLNVGANAIGWAHHGGCTVFHAKNESLTFVGTGAQTYSYAAGGQTARLRINKTGGSVSPAGGTTAIQVNGFEMLAGTFNAPSGVLSVGMNIGCQLYNTPECPRDATGHGDCTVFLMSGGTFNAGTGTVSFVPAEEENATYTGNFLLDTEVPLTLNNVNVQMSDIFFNTPTSFTHSGPATVTVQGAFSHAYGDLDGPWILQGNASWGSSAAGGIGTITLSGTQAQLFTAAAGSIFPSGTVTINKAAGAVSLGSAWSLNATGQGLTLQAGTLDMLGFALQINGVLTNNGTITKGGGSLTYGSLTGGGTINP
jgi:hypothetical protein